MVVVGYGMGYVICCGWYDVCVMSYSVVCTVCIVWYIVYDV